MSVKVTDQIAKLTATAELDGTDRALHVKVTGNAVSTQYTPFAPTEGGQVSDSEAPIFVATQLTIIQVIFHNTGGVSEDITLSVLRSTDSSPRVVWRSDTFEAGSSFWSEFIILNADEELNAFTTTAATVDYTLQGYLVG